MEHNEPETWKNVLTRVSMFFHWRLRLCQLQQHRPWSVEYVRLRVVSLAAWKQGRTRGRGSAVFKGTISTCADVVLSVRSGSSPPHIAGMSVMSVRVFTYFSLIAEIGKPVGPLTRAQIHRRS